MILTTFTIVPMCQANADTTNDSKDVDDCALLTSKYLFCTDTNAKYRSTDDKDDVDDCITVANKYILCIEVHKSIVVS